MHVVDQGSIPDTTYCLLSTLESALSMARCGPKPKKQKERACISVTLTQPTPHIQAADIPLAKNLLRDWGGALATMQSSRPRQSREGLPKASAEEFKAPQVSQKQRPLPSGLRQKAPPNSFSFAGRGPGVNQCMVLFSSSQKIPLATPGGCSPFSPFLSLAQRVVKLNRVPLESQLLAPSLPLHFQDLT